MYTWIDLEKCNFWNFSDLDLDLGSGRNQTGTHMRSKFTHTPS